MVKYKKIICQAQWGREKLNRPQSAQFRASKLGIKRSLGPWIHAWGGSLDLWMTAGWVVGTIRGGDTDIDTCCNKKNSTSHTHRWQECTNIPYMFSCPLSPSCPLVLSPLMWAEVAGTLKLKTLFLHVLGVVGWCFSSCINGSFSLY